MTDTPPAARPPADADAERPAGFSPQPLVLQRIDWDAVAPWTVLGRVLGLAILPSVWLVGAVLALVSGFEGATPAALSEGWSWPFDRAVAGLFAPLAAAASAAGDGSPKSLAYAAGVDLLWGVACAVVAARVAPKLIGTREITIVAALRATPRWLGACVVLLAPGALLLALAWGVSGVIPSDGVVATTVLWPLLLAFSAVAAVLLAIAAVGSLLAVVAAVVDRADAFDAASRAFAYASQRPLRLLAYATLAVALGVASGLLLEALLAGAIALANALVGDPGAAGDWWIGKLAVAARGYYVAYSLVVATVLYLLMRQAVDGQPIDDPGPAGYSVDAPGAAPDAAASSN